MPVLYCLIKVWMTVSSIIPFCNLMFSKGIRGISAHGSPWMGWDGMGSPILCDQWVSRQLGIVDVFHLDQFKRNSIHTSKNRSRKWQPCPLGVRDLKIDWLREPPPPSKRGNPQIVIHHRGKLCYLLGHEMSVSWSFSWGRCTVGILDFEAKEKIY